jgi:hypothetical protein
MIPARSRLLLETCLGPPQSRREALMRWLELTRFDDIDPGSHVLLPSVGYFNRDQPLPEFSRLRGLFRHNWAINQRCFRLVSPALAALQEAGLNPVLLKGARGGAKITANGRFEKHRNIL